MTPDQLFKTQQIKWDELKSAHTQRKENWAAFGARELLTPDQLCKAQQIKRDQQKAADI